MVNTIVVDVVMTTFNQEKYIAKAIESVIAQKTDFAFRLIIGEDCSTDNTRAICNDYAKIYPEKIIVIENNNNVGLIQNYISCFGKCEAEFVAILEGDDYWSDPYKLQKQVNLMINNDDVGLTHANYLQFIEKKQIYKQNPEKLSDYCLDNQGYIYEKLITVNFICPLTVMFRKKYLEDIDNDFLIDNNISTIDFFLWLNISLKSKILYVNEIYGVYRISDNSISNNSDFEKRIKFARTKNKIMEYFIQKYPVANLDFARLDNRTNMTLFLRALRTFNFKYIAHYSTRFSLLDTLHVLTRYFKFYR